MKITLFTSNNIRHISLINMLSSVCNELFVVQESKTIFPGIMKGSYEASEIIENYFKNVSIAQSRLFKDTHINCSKVNILPIQLGDLNHINISKLKDFLKSDIYIVFGSSFIKGELIEFLVKNKAINIHMGVSPYYRGTDCNFWALFDNNPVLVGATIHLLTNGLDSGPILYHALSDFNKDPYLYTMSTVKSAFVSLVQRIGDESIFRLNPIQQDTNKGLRYSKSSDFNNKIVQEFFKMKIDLNLTNRNQNLFKDPYILKNI